MPHRIEIHLYIHIRLTELLASSATDRIRNVRCYLIASRKINRTAKAAAKAKAHVHMYTICVCVNVSVSVIPAYRKQRNTMGTLNSKHAACMWHSDVPHCKIMRSLLAAAIALSLQAAAICLP